MYTIVMAVCFNVSLQFFWSLQDVRFALPMLSCRSDADEALLDHTPPSQGVSVTSMFIVFTMFLVAIRLALNAFLNFVLDLCNKLAKQKLTRYC